MKPAPSDTHPIGRSATAADVPAVAACLTGAFHEDPLWGHWTFPDAAARPQLLGRFMEFWARCGVRTPWLHMTAGREALTVWLPPGEPEMTADEDARFGTLLDDLFGPRAPQLTALFDQFETHHPRDEPHFYLSWWATHPDHLGRGLGSALLREDLARIDAEHRAAYLESTNPANLPRYEALGFSPRSTLGPPGGPIITTMWRPAR